MTNWRLATPYLESAAGACARHIEQALADEVRREGTASLAISGGSSPKPLFRALAQSGLPWSRIHLFWVDERCVPPDHDESNFRVANELLVGPAGIPPSNVHRIEAELGPEEAARCYERDLRSHFRLREGAMPQFTVVHLGMGPDAHTASLFPGEPLIDDRQGLAAAVWVEKLATHRVTLLPGVLLAACETVFLAAGEDKAKPLEQVLRGPLDERRLPAQVVARHGQDVAWFLDAAAAGRLMPA